MNREERSEIVNKDAERPERKGKITSGRLLGLTGMIMMLIVALACLGLVIPKIVGFDAYVVVSGSMEPNVPVGSLVFAKKVDPSQLERGDVIVFIDPSRGTKPITHRVVRNDTANARIITKGDANSQEDPNPAAYENVIGKVYYYLPRLGFVAATLTSTLGKIVALLMLVEAWLLIEISKRKKC